ncbi:MAG: small basic family protein [Patescibacteria group bacterium]|jgi:small basic protein
MYLIILGLSLGLIMGAFLQINIPPELARYTAVAIVGVLDSLFGAIRASIEKKYSTTIFLSGLAFNMIIAVLITFIGDKLNLDLYLAILVAFVIRIFANIGIIKTTAFGKIWKQINIESKDEMGK